MLDRWRWSAQHLIFVYRYHMRRAAFGDTPLFDASFLPDAVSFAGLDLQDQEYLQGVIQWSFGTDMYRLYERTRANVGGRTP